MPARSAAATKTQKNGKPQAALLNSAVLILAGGRGTRFWPESRLDRPKPLFSINGKTTLLADTVARMHPLISPDRVFVLAAADQVSFFRPILKRLVPDRNLIVEPEGRGTAVAIAYGTALIANRLGDETVLAVMPADHYVAPASGFQHTLRQAIALADAYRTIVVIGIEPTRPETGYGYQKLGAAVELPSSESPAKLSPRRRRGDDSPSPAFKLQRFVEKPSASAALKMVRSGKYLWNAGMFVMRASTLVQELDQHATGLAQAMRSFASLGREQLVRSYRRLVFDSFDRVVAEKSRHVMSVRAGFQWHDVGSWEGLWEALRGRERNVVSGTVLTLDSDGVLARAGERLMVLLGVKNIVAVETADAILIADRTQSQDVRRVIEELRRRRLHQYL